MKFWLDCILRFYKISTVMKLLTDGKNLPLEILRILFEASIFPLVMFILFLVILEMTKNRYSITERFQLCILFGVLFLIGAIGAVHLTTDYLFKTVAHFTYTASGVCGLGISLYAYRLSKLRGIPIWTIITWILITGATLLIVLERIIVVFR